MTDRDDARRRLQEAYGGRHDEDVGDLAAYHDAATSYLATLDTHAPDEMPEDLPASTRRQLKTAVSVLEKALTGIEQTAEDRLED